MHLLDLPEEVLELVLGYIRKADSVERDAYLLLPILAASRVLHRIGTPILYDSIYICSPAIAELLLQGLVSPSSPAHHIRTLSFPEIYPSIPAILRLLCPSSLQALTFRLEVGLSPSDIHAHRTSGLVPFDTSRVVVDTDLRRRVALDFIDALDALAPGPRSLVLLPALSANSRILHQSVRDILLRGAARAIGTWTALLEVELGYIPAPVPTTTEGGILSPDVASPSAITSAEVVGSLTGSLARLPNLRTMRALMPNMWSDGLGSIAVNPSLERLEMFVLHVVSSGRYELQVSAAADEKEKEKRRPPLARRLPHPEFFYDKVLEGVVEKWGVTRAQILGAEGDGVGWIVEARKRPRVLEVLLAGAERDEDECGVEGRGPGLGR